MAVAVLSLKDIERFSFATATDTLGRKAVERVMSEPTIDSTGSEALRVTIVLKPGAAARLKGSAVVNTLLKIQDRLLESGDGRLPIVEYATEEELAAGDDAQP